MRNISSDRSMGKSPDPRSHPSYYISNIEVAPVWGKESIWISVTLWYVITSTAGNTLRSLYWDRLTWCIMNDYFYIFLAPIPKKYALGFFFIIGIIIFIYSEVFPNFSVEAMSPWLLLQLTWVTWPSFALYNFVCLTRKGFKLKKTTITTLCEDIFNTFLHCSLVMISSWVVKFAGNDIWISLCGCRPRWGARRAEAERKIKRASIIELPSHFSWSGWSKSATGRP